MIKVRDWDARGEDVVVLIEIGWLNAEVDYAFFDIAALCLC